MHDAHIHIYVYDICICIYIYTYICSHRSTFSRKRTRFCFDRFCLRKKTRKVDLLNKTAHDVRGRIESKYCLTASNVAKAAGCHGMVVLRDHHPLHWDRDVIFDAISTAQEWHRRSHEMKPECKYPFTFWNCLRKSGASQLHGHMQTMLMPNRFPGNIELLLRAAKHFQSSQGRDYFQELLWCHDQLGLTSKLGNATALAHIAARKEREMSGPDSPWGLA